MVTVHIDWAREYGKRVPVGGISTDFLTWRRLCRTYLTEQV